MEKHQLDRIMRIAQKTQSPVIVLDENQEEVVILPLTAYEELIDGYSEDEMELPAEFFTDEDFQEILEDSGTEELLSEPVLESSEMAFEGSEGETEDLGGANKGFEVEKELEEGHDLSEEQFYLEPVE
ncbi:hypothetical protein HN358_04755 [Candidatus Uhrbacteria bacterium]|jgi:hypothetical protein|nr:hypothetical protein [Candidatus Uhrbacteria bacterium]MBT7717093.1 hypothetical protein [Candidatus Uhrbacteria bacterium]